MRIISNLLIVYSDQNSHIKESELKRKLIQKPVVGNTAFIIY